MLTICWTASSWPTTRLSRVFSKDSASLPVLVGSRTFRNRLISASPSFLFFRQIPVTPHPCEIELLNLAELHTQKKQTACQTSDHLFRFFPSVQTCFCTITLGRKIRSFPLVLLWSGRSHFNSAYERSFW